MGVAVLRAPVGTRSPKLPQKFGHGPKFVGQLLSRNQVTLTVVFKSGRHLPTISLNLGVPLTVGNTLVLSTNVVRLLF